jgi:hypothetical protein
MDINPKGLGPGRWLQIMHPQNIGMVPSSKKGKAPGRVGGERKYILEGLLHLIFR